MKLPGIVITILCLSISAASCYAQFIPVTTTMHTPYGNVSQTYYVPGSRMYYGSTSNSVSYRFTITLQNDSTFTKRTRIEIGEGDHFFKLKINGSKKEIKPGNTKSVYRITYEGDTLRGIPADSCWLFKVKTGKINLYSFLAEQSLKYVIAIQEGEGWILPMRKEVLREIMKDYPDLLALVEKNKLLKAVKIYNER